MEKQKFLTKFDVLKSQINFSYNFYNTTNLACSGETCLNKKVETGEKRQEQNCSFVPNLVDVGVDAASVEHKSGRKTNDQGVDNPDYLSKLSPLAEFDTFTFEEDSKSNCHLPGSKKTSLIRTKMHPINVRMKEFS